jgi:ABC-2 type transport system permease protein
VLPASAYGAFGSVAQWLPSGALGEAMRDAFLHGTVAWRDLVVLLAWAVVGTGATTRTFSWE